MNIKEFIKQNENGFSLQIKENNILENVNIKNGFSVALTDNITSLEICEQDLKILLKMANLINIKNEKMFIGGWKDDINYYLDLSLWVENKEEAILIAKIFNQKAIYDFKNKESIKVDFEV